MCGIAGLIRYDGREALPATLAGTAVGMAHRGPEDRGFAALGPEGCGEVAREPRFGAGTRAAMAHLRLSILDLSEAGRQPMVTADGRLALVFNGEIYNYLELRAELEREGATFCTGTDTEVLLEAWRAWGRKSLARFTGMFAFALFDANRRTVTLARDPFGIKPLYYALEKHLFAFASEPKGLLALPELPRRAEPQQVYEYLLQGSADGGERTFFEGIRQVPPAHLLEVSLDAFAPAAPERYWALPEGPARRVSFADAAASVRAVFLDNVRLHLRSDVPLGAALSGGIDSSAIVAGMRAVAPGAEIRTFSYLARDPRVDEERFADLACAAAGAVPHKVAIEPDELVRDLDALVRMQDEPFGSTSIYAQYRVMRLAAENGIKVMLDGQGADEMLAGYRPYLGSFLASLVRNLRLGMAARLALHALRDPSVSFSGVTRSALRRLLPAGAVRSLRQATPPAWARGEWFRERGVRHPLPATASDRDLLRLDLRESMVNGLVQLLRYEDRNSMAHSIESRVPFLTPALCTEVLTLPEEYILGPDGESKRVLRAALRGLVPDPILDRRDKIGFATPELAWLRTLSPWVERRLAGEALERLGPLDPAAVRREWADVREGRKPFDFRIWRFINLTAWAETYDVAFS